MRFKVLTPFRIRGELFNAGATIEATPDAAEKLGNRIEPVRPHSTAWLEGGELRTSGYTPDLPGAICKLTEDNLPLQRTLLQRHCEAYDRNHFWTLAEEWEERAAIMQHEGGMERCKAETEAARRLNLLAYLDDLQAKGEIAA